MLISVRGAVEILKEHVDHQVPYQGRGDLSLPHPPCVWIGAVTPKGPVTRKKLPLQSLQSLSAAVTRTRSLRLGLT
eukprot:2110022-Rhodomonas_salina.1